MDISIHRYTPASSVILTCGLLLIASTAIAVDAPAKTGKQVAEAACAMCHSTGAAGAPKTGDATAWSPRIAQGTDKLVEHVVKGYKAMPARGTCTKCTDVEIKSAVEYFIAKAQEKK